MIRIARMRVLGAFEITRLGTVVHADFIDGVVRPGSTLVTADQRHAINGVEFVDGPGLPPSAVGLALRESGVAGRFAAGEVFEVFAP